MKASSSRPGLARRPASHEALSPRLLKSANGADASKFPNSRHNEGCFFTGTTSSSFSGAQQFDDKNGGATNIHGRFTFAPV